MESVLRSRVALLVPILALFACVLAASPGIAAVTPERSAAVDFCTPLPLPTADVVEVGTVEELVEAVDEATPGRNIVLLDGLYEMDGEQLLVNTDGVTIIGKSRDAGAVVLDGGYITDEVIRLTGSDVTVAHLTIQRPSLHAIHVTGSDEDTVGTLIYGVDVIDPRQQAIKINASTTAYADDGVIACSSITMTDVGRPNIDTSTTNPCYTGGIDAVEARDWLIRDNTIEGFYCDVGISGHGIHFWRGSRDTQVVRNRLIDNARGIGFGLTIAGTFRTYPDDPCGVGVVADHYGGLIANNFVSAVDEDLFDSAASFDSGIALANACGPVVAHNSVASIEAPFASIEWRFANTDATLFNNLSSHGMVERDGASSVVEGNIEDAPASEWVDLPIHDLHLTGSASAIGQGGPLGVTHAPSDIDGDLRTMIAPDVGADSVPRCDGLVVTVDIGAGDVPTSGRDVILGTDGPDVILGLAGDDTICGLGGDDTIAGHAGNDTIFGDDGMDTIYGGLDDDVIHGGPDADVIQGNDGVDTLNGDDGNDTLSGNNGDDTLNGGPDDDTLYGVAGIDTINGDAGMDTILGGLHGDVISGGPDNDLISGNAGPDEIDGDDGDDTLYGSTEDDTINGGVGWDIILGGTGDDTIDGGSDRDLISGNEDDDIIDGGPGDDDLFGVDGVDTINGEAGVDLILGGNDDDIIAGGPDGDLISGNAGNDIIDGGGGNDEIYGVTGEDDLTGGVGEDIILGGPDNDTIEAVDGFVDQVSGNAGTDTCNADPIDNVFACELP